MQTQQFQDTMTEATRLTRAGRLADATALIQRALGHSAGGDDGPAVGAASTAGGASGTAGGAGGAGGTGGGADGGGRAGGGAVDRLQQGSGGAVSLPPCSSSTC